MKSLVCPRCGSELVEDVWENLQLKEDGGFIMDAYPIYICKGKCGYMRRISEVPQIIAQQGDDQLLLVYPNEQGRILDIRNAVVSPPIFFESLLARGGWEDYTGNYDVDALLENARESEAAFLQPPNLFKFATSELSQDAFLCWLLSWSKHTYRSINRPLHDAAYDFITMIFNVHHIPVPKIESINITRQFHSLDILAIANNTYAILIEDKTFTKDHSNQLIRYRETVKEKYPKLIQLPIYYKISDQSHYQSLDTAGYILFKRKMMLEILKAGKENGVDNAIFIDYFDHLQMLDDRISAFRTAPVAEWDSYAWQGFYQELQSEIPGNWGYVPNAAGGFWAFWWKPAANNGYYVQLEQERLCVKIKAEGGEDMREVQNKILLESEEHGLMLQKPAKLKAGKTMTIAYRPDYIQLNNDGTANLKRTFEELMKY